MNKNLKNLLLTGGTLGAAGVGSGITAGVASLILFNKTLPRPRGTDPEIIDEFADRAKMEEYKVRMAPVGEWMERQAWEHVTLRARDGLRLHALFLAAERPMGKLAIFHHGFTSHAVDNASHAKFFHEQGYEVLLLDLRAHGESEGDYVGFGILDRYDTLEWVRWARARFGKDVKIVLHDHLPPAPIIKLTSARAQKAAGYRFDEYSTLDALKNNRVPVLFVHGKEDKFVPTWMSQKNYEACPSKKRLLMVEGAGHGSSVFENQPLYEQTEKAFLADALGE